MDSCRQNPSRYAGMAEQGCAGGMPGDLPLKARIGEGLLQQVNCLVQRSLLMCDIYSISQLDNLAEFPTKMAAKIPAGADIRMKSLW